MLKEINLLVINRNKTKKGTKNLKGDRKSGSVKHKNTLML